MRTLCALAALAGPAPGQYRYDHFTTNNGLPQNTVAAIAQTPDGFLWFATYDGLVRYDGIRFVVFDKASTAGVRCNVIQSLCVDPNGTLWAGTVDSGLMRVRAGVFACFSTDHGLTEKNISKVACGPQGAPIFFYGAQRSLLWDDAGQRPIALAPAEHCWLDAETCHWRLEGDRLTRTTKADGASTTFHCAAQPEDFIRFRYADRRGNLWIGGQGSLWRAGPDGVRRYATADGLPSEGPSHVAGEDRDGNVWLQTVVGPFRMDGEKPTRIPGPGGAPFGHVRSVFCDREGAVWVGTNDRGVFRLSRQFLTAFAPMQGKLGDTVYPVFEDRNGRVAMGCRDGIVWHDGGRFTAQALVANSAESPGYSLAPPGEPGERATPRSFFQDDAGRLWIGHSRGIAIENAGRLLDCGAAVNGASVDVMVRDRDGAIWAGTHQGLFQLQLEQGAPQQRAHFTEADGLPDRRVNAILCDRAGRLWVGTRSGLARRSGARFEVFAGGQLDEHRIRCIHEDERGVLWVGSFDYGLWRIEGEAATRIAAGDGLRNNGVFQILDDGRGNFWLSSNRGIDRVRRQQLDDFAAGRIRVVHCVGYGSDDGMATTECNGERQPAGVKTRDGKLWFPTQRGMVVIDPALTPFNDRPPDVSIESVLVDRRSAPFADGIELAPGQTDLEINYTAPSSFKADFAQFKYQMAGLNDAWIDAGARRSVHYSHLPHGSYDFRVIAANSDGVWNETGARIHVVVRPHFYQTWTFLIGSTLGGLALAGAAVGLRVRDLKANARKLNSMVDEKTAALRHKTEELERANRQLEALASQDGLTNIANHRRFKEFLAAEWQRGQRGARPLSVLLLDVDHFKLFNDAYGHQQGDDCLRQVARVLSDAANRVADLSARYGGEEFAVVLPDTDAVGARQVAETIRARVEALRIPHVRSATGPVVTVSIGSATTVPERGASPDALIAAADRELYRAKSAGRNRVSQ